MSRARALALVLVSLLVGCDIAATSHPSPPRPTGVRLALYLNGPEKTPFEAEIELAEIDAVRDDGSAEPILLRPVKLNALEIVEHQLLLAESFLPPGYYAGIKVRATRARVRLEGKWSDLAVPKDAVRIAVPFELRRAQAGILFMTWDVARSIEQEVLFRPAFGLEGRAQELRGLLLYVTNEGSDTVSVIDRSTDRVVDLVEVGRAPKGLTLIPRRGRVFVVNSGSDSLSVIDVTGARAVHTTNLELRSSPSDAVVTPDGQTLYVSNTALNSVSAIDASSFQIIATIPVGLRPTTLALAPSASRLLVADTGTSTVTVIDTGRHAVVATIPVDFQPSGLAFDATGSELLVSHLGSPRLAIVTLGTLRVVRTVNTGPAVAVFSDVDGASGRVFVARVRESRLALFDLNANTDVDAIAVGDDPRAFALDPDREKLYIVNQGSDTVSVVDKQSRRLRTTLAVGKRPYAIAIMP